MHVLITCKNEDDSIKKEGARVKNEGARVVTTFFPLFPDPQWQLTPQSLVGFVLREFMVVHGTCKNEDPIKNEGGRSVTTFSPL